MRVRIPLKNSSCMNPEYIGTCLLHPSLIIGYIYTGVYSAERIQLPS